jgi:(p)ppGpp synthase/HD superfamily hydrolase
MRAQTNIQLYRQLLAARHAVAQVQQVRDAYALAARLFAAQLRPEGRPFVCHLVGVASLLAQQETAFPIVLAGLLHSAYTHGDFGGGPGVVTAHARDALREAVGADAEALAWRYARHPWNADTVEWLIERARAQDGEVRALAAIRLADMLDDMLDDGLRFCAKEANPRRAIAVERLLELAAVVECPRLGAALDSLHADAGADPPEVLRSPRAASYVVAPPSWREKLLPRVARRLRSVRRAR